MSPITTHVLDTALGMPGRGIGIHLYFKQGDTWKQLATGATNEDGRIADLLDNDYNLKKGIYKMHFKIGHYFNLQERPSFYPYVDIIFEIKSSQEHYHIPLLLSPFGYTTYRGS